MPVSGVSVGALGNSFRVQATFFDEFFGLDTTLLYVDSSTGTGAVAAILAGNAAADEGLGIIEFDTGAGLGEALISTGQGFRGSLATVAEFRVKLPVIPGDVTFSWGFDDGAGSSCKVGYAQGETDWDFIVESQDGGNSDSDLDVLPISGGWQTIRLEWLPNSLARLYISNVLISTLSGAGAIPRAGDQMSLFFSVGRLAGPASQVYADWVRAIVQRA